MALTKVPSELSSTPGIVDNSNDTAITIDGSENVLVGTTQNNPTSSGVNVAGQEFSTTGGVRSTVDANPAATFNRKTDNGSIALFRKDGSTVGSIGSEGGDALYIQSGTTLGSGLHFHPTSALVRPARNGVTVDGVINLGAGTRRFKDLFLSGGAYLGGTAAANKLDDYEEGTFTVTFANTAGDMTATNLSFNASGKYVKVGELVFVRGEVATQGTLGGSGGAAVLLTGFPFASPNSTYIKIYVDDSGSYNKPSVAPTSIEIVGATTQARVKTSSNVYQTNMPQSELAQSGNGNRFYFNGVYRTTD